MLVYKHKTNGRLHFYKPKPPSQEKLSQDFVKSRTQGEAGIKDVEWFNHQISCILLLQGMLINP